MARAAPKGGSHRNQGGLTISLKESDSILLVIRPLVPRSFFNRDFSISNGGRKTSDGSYPLASRSPINLEPSGFSTWRSEATALDLDLDL